MVAGQEIESGTLGQDAIQKSGDLGWNKHVTPILEELTWLF